MTGSGVCAQEAWINKIQFQVFTIKLHLIHPRLPSYVFNGGSDELPKSASKAATPFSGNQAAISDQLIEKARADSDAVLKEELDGLSAAEAESRLERYGLK